MSIETILSVAAFVLTILIAPLLFIWKMLMQRINNVEKQLEGKASKSDVKDSLLGIKEDVKAMDTKINLMLQHLINSSKDKE